MSNSPVFVVRSGNYKQTPITRRMASIKFVSWL